MKTTFKPVSLLIVLATLGLFNACGYQQANKEAPEINVIKKNTRFSIILPEDHTKGLSWHLDQRFNNACVEQLNAVWHGNEKGIDYCFEAIGVGQTTLNLSLRRYKDTLNVKSFIVKIIEN